MVKLIPMAEDDFRVYLEDDIRKYAEVNVEAGYWHPSEALEKSKQVHAQLLPDGVATKNQHLFSVFDEDTGEKIGLIWIEVKADAPIPSAFIYDFVINEERRGRGYGAQTLSAAEAWLKSMNIKKLALHVFGSNVIARRLYERAGFEVSSLNMMKSLD
jgi:RimJ/RimL family protein N-acetyltransferase